MAVPMLLPLLLTGASTLANTMAARKQQKALADAQAAERMRQRQFDEESYALNARARDQYQDVGEQKAERSESLADMFKGTTEAPPVEPVVAMPQSSSNLVVQNEARETADAKATTNDRADRRAQMLSFSDMFGDLSRQTGRTAGDLSMIGSFRRGSQNVLPLELQAAQEKGKGLMFLGDLLSLGAGLTTGPALTGTSIFGGGPQLVSGPGVRAAGLPGMFGRVPRPMPRPY